MIDKSSNVILNLIGTIFLSCIFLLGLNMTVVANNVDADFKVKISTGRFEVSTLLKGVGSDIVYIRFRNQGVGKENVDKRIKEIHANTLHGKKLTIKRINNSKKIYSIRTLGKEEIKINYTLNPDVSWWDHHFSVIDENNIYIPIEYFIFEAYSDVNCNNFIYNNVKFYFSDLPKDWEILTTCPVNSNGSVDIKSTKSIIHAGKYSIEKIKKGDNVFKIAINDDLDINKDEYLRELKKIIDYQYTIFGKYIYQDALIVINSKPDYNFFFNFGGQVKDKSNVIIFTSDLSESPDNESEFLAHFAHETFHLWLPESFELKENMYWFTEGFTKYQEFRILWKLGIINQEEFHKMLTEEYVTLEKIQEKKRISLIESGKYVFKNNDYRILNYSKGSLVAHLLAEKLNSKDKSFEGLMRFIHNKYAKEIIPIGSDEVVSAINNYLGDSEFTKKWIVDYQKISEKDIEKIQPYIKKERLKQFLVNPPLFVRLLVIVVGFLILFVVIKKLYIKSKYNQ